MKTKEEARLDMHLTRALRRGLPATLTTVEWTRTVADFHGRCAYCGNADVSVMEHFVPVARGGGTTAGNCLPSCEPCNTMKGSRHPDALGTMLGAATLAGLRRYLAGRSTGVDVVPRVPPPQRKREGRGRTERINVSMSDAEWEMVGRAAALGGENVTGFLRRLGLEEANRQVGAAKGAP